MANRLLTVVRTILAITILALIRVVYAVLKECGLGFEV